MSASTSPETALFLGNENAGFYGKLMLIGGGLLLVAAVFIGVVLILLPPDFSPDQSTLIWIVTAPMLAGLTLISAGWSQWRAPQQVDIDAESVTLHTGAGVKRIAWPDVVALQTGEKSTAMGNTKLQTVRLLGSNRRLLIELNSHLQPFDELVVKLWELGSIGRELELIDTSHKRRRAEAWFLVLLGPAFAALGLWVGSEASRELQQRAAFADHAVETQGVVEKHYLFNVTPRLEYVFHDDEGTEHRRSTIVARDTWNHLKEGDSVAVRYLPERPEYSRLAEGDSDDRASHDPQTMAFAGPLCAVMGVLFFVVGVLQFCGIDVERWGKQKKRK